MVSGKAIIIVGINRSGTSAIAASLDSINIPLGEQSYKPIFEDVQLARCFRAQDWRSFKQIVASYSSRHPLYAWKLPDAVNDLSRVNKLFEDKKFIFVFRDVYAIALRKEQALEQSVLDSMVKSNKQYQRVLNFIARSKIDYLMVSYEKMLIEPLVYANRLLEYLGLEKSDTNIRHIVGSIEASPRDYLAWSDRAKQEKMLTENKISGHLDDVTNSRISGWAKALESEDSLDLEVFVDGILVAECSADYFRADLVSAGISLSGKHGFDIELPNRVEPGSTISVVEKNNHINLIGSPAKVQ